MLMRFCTRTICNMKLIVLLCSLALANAAADLNELLGVQNLIPAELANFGGANGVQGAVAALAQLVQNPQTLVDIYDRFKEQFQVDGNNSTVDDSAIRLPIFLQRLQSIAQHNAEADQGQHTYYQGVNRFTDRTPLELSSFTGAITSGIADFIGRLSPRQAPAPADDSWKTATVPDAFDWRNEKIISPAKDQGQCGSCITFASAALTEAYLTKAYYAKNGNAQNVTFDLSEQELGDCPTAKSGEGGCNGNSPKNVLNYISTSGVTTEQSYPYEGPNAKKSGFLGTGLFSSVIGGRSCRAAGKTRTVTKATWTYVQPQGVDHLKYLVATQGPMLVTMRADTTGLSPYKSGVYTGTCGPTVDHGVVIVGYGTDENGIDYWIVKNSWAEKWGEKGFFRIRRDLCGLTEIAYYITSIQGQI